MYSKYRVRMCLIPHCQLMATVILDTLLVHPIPTLMSLNSLLWANVGFLWANVGFLWANVGFLWANVGFLWANVVFL